MEGVYLIHLNKPLSPNHTSRHYIGFATDVDARIQKHLKGGTDAARFMQVAKERDIDWVVARTWAGGTRSFERSLKNRKNASRLCPVCIAAKGGKGKGVTVGETFRIIEKSKISDMKLYPLDDDNIETIEQEVEEAASLARKFLEVASTLMPTVLPSKKKIMDYMESIIDDYMDGDDLNMTALAEAACEYFNAYEGEEDAVPEIFYEVAANMRDKI